jgi:uncharacterized protein
MAALALGADAVFVGARHISVRQIEVQLRRLPAAFDGFAIAHLSDLHYSRWAEDLIREAVRLTNQLHADLIMLTGDFVTVRMWHKRDAHAAADAEPCAEIIAALRSRHGSFAVLGNHDHFSDSRVVVSSLETRGIQVLRNRALAIHKDAARIWIAGLGDVLGGDDDLDSALQGIPGDEAVVLGVHEPDYAKWVMRRRVDLQLSGHSHGGQIRLPLVGAPFLPPLGRKYPLGLYRLGALTLYTNPGIGTIRLPARFNCPPEITLLRLRTATPT